MARMSALESRAERGGLIHPNALALTRRGWWLGPAMLVSLGLLVVAWFLPTMTVEKVPWIWSTKFSIWRVIGGLYAGRLGRAWYLSSSGRWDRWIAALHAPLWLLALIGGLLWARRSRSDPALWLALSVIGYMWLVSALASGLARYLAAVYGLLGMLAGVAALGASHALRSRPSSPSRRWMSSS